MSARLLLVLALVLQTGCFLGRIYRTDWPAPVEAHQVKTSDGWLLDLRHVKPTGAPAHPRPVIVVHGIVTNGRNMDLDDAHSLARELAKQGFDVWIPSLRNTGLSEKRSFFATPADQLNFDAFASRDLPAIIDYVREKTGAAQVDYVGHSMGGMLLYAYLARGGSGIARAVTLGSPTRMRWTGRMEQTLRDVTNLTSVVNWLPVRAFTLSTLPWEGSIDGPLERLLISRENITLASWRAFLAVGVDDIPTPLAAQFAGWVEHGRFASVDGSVDYLEGLRRVTVPMLIVAGKIDGIAPPWMVRPAFDALGATEKRWLVLGEANGQRFDYNHMDMLLGEHAATEVFPLVASFLRR